MKGIRAGKGLRVLGPLLLRIDGDAKNIVLGKNITLLPYVDIKNRGNGKIILHDGVFIETNARLLAVNDATLELGDHAQVGIGTVINAGVDVIIGRYTAIAGHCTIVASEHGYSDMETPIKFQGYTHAPIYIGEDVWLATNVVVRPGVHIDEGTVVGAYAVVHEDLPANIIAVGNPAREVKKRGV